jgi:hypothetical protein
MYPHSRKKNSKADPVLPDTSPGKANINIDPKSARIRTGNISLSCFEASERARRRLR